MFGYWLGKNKLAKNNKLAYKDGPLGLFIMDNYLARTSQPIGAKAIKAFAQWADTQQTNEFKDKAIWKNDLQSVPTCHSTPHDNPDYKPIKTIVESWISSIHTKTTTPASSAFSLIDIALINPLTWLIDQLSLGGMARLEANHTAIIITALIRNLLVKNWSDRAISLPPSLCKFKLKHQRRAKNVKWGQECPIGNNQPKDAVVLEDNSNSDEEDEIETPSKNGSALLRNNRPNDFVPQSPKHHSFETYNVPKERIAFITRRIAASITETYSALITLAKIQYY
jgi:hypothetical protein